MAQKAQHAILRFAKHKAGPAGALEAHHERTKEQYASNPDIDTSRSRDNFHIVQPTQKYRREIDSRIKAAGCRTRKDSTMFVDTLITASPEFFTGRSKREVQAYFTEAVTFMEKKIGRGNIFSAVVHMDEKRPTSTCASPQSPRTGGCQQRRFWATGRSFPSGRTSFTPICKRRSPSSSGARAPLSPKENISPHGYSNSL